MQFERKHKISTAIPSASLPDIIFMLLIFFMVATVFKQFSGLKVSLPDAEMVRKIPGSKRHIVTIWIDRNNQVVCEIKNRQWQWLMMFSRKCAKQML